MDPDRELGNRGAPRRLTFNPVFDGYPVWAPDGRRVAFLQGLISGGEFYDGARRLVTLAPDGRDPRVLVTHDGDEWETGLAMQPPVWSPDGRRLAFASVEDDVLALFTIAVDGSDRRRVAAIRAWEPSSAPGRETLGPRRFATVGDVAWSPDGTKLLFTYGPSVCVVTPDGALVGEATLFPGDPYYACLAPDLPQERGLPGRTDFGKQEAVAAWSPRGDRIAFAFAVADGFHYEDSRDV